MIISIALAVLGRRRRLVCAVSALACLLAVAPVKAEIASCPALKQPISARVEAVVDAQTLRIEGGQEVRLMAAMPLAADDPDALAVLRQLVAPGDTISLYRGVSKIDRHGRMLAHAVTAADVGAVWLQEELIGQGVARAYALSDNRACIAWLLRREQAARQSGARLWGTGALRVYPAYRPEALEPLVDTFQIVEGKPVSVGRTKRTIYVNFGRVWKRDFTLIIPLRRDAAFARAGIMLDDLAGKRIRVRGWLERRGGPAITLQEPDLLEIVEQD